MAKLPEKLVLEINDGKKFSVTYVRADSLKEFLKEELIALVKGEKMNKIELMQKIGSLICHDCAGSNCGETNISECGFIIKASKLFDDFLIQMCEEDPGEENYLGNKSIRGFIKDINEGGKLESKDYLPFLVPEK